MDVNEQIRVRITENAPEIRKNVEIPTIILERLEIARFSRDFQKQNSASNGECVSKKRLRKRPAKIAQTSNSRFPPDQGCVCGSGARLRDLAYDSRCFVTFVIH